MGGGSSVAGMVAFRGTSDDYDEWEAAGARGWSWSSVLPYFCKLETDRDFAGPRMDGLARSRFAVYRAICGHHSLAQSNTTLQPLV